MAGDNNDAAEEAAPDVDDDDDEKGGNVREQDRFLPIANISRIMKKALPANAKQGDTPKNGKNDSGGDAQGTLGGNQNSAGYGQVF